MEILSFFNEKIYPVLEDLEKKRKIIIRNGRLNQFLFVGVIVLFFIRGYNRTSHDNVPVQEYFITLSIIIFLAIVVFAMKPQLFLFGKDKVNKYKSGFKQDVVFAFLSTFNMNIKYKPCFKTSDNFLNRTHLFNKKITESIEHDGILGELTKTEFRFSQTLLYKNASVFFQGIIIVINQPSDYDGHIMINSDKLKSHDSFFEILKTDCFSIKSDYKDLKADAVFGRQIQLIADMHKKFGKKDIQATMTGNLLLIAIEQKKNIFDLSFRNVIKQKDFIYSNLTFLGNIMDFLQENDKLFASSVSEMNQNMA